MASPFLERTRTLPEKHRRVERPRKGFPTEISVFGRSGRGFLRLVLVFVDDRSERRDVLVVTAQLHHADALRRPAGTPDVVDGHPDHRACRRDQHDLVAVANHTGADELAALLDQPHGLDAEASSAGPTVVVDPCAFPVAVL